MFSKVIVNSPWYFIILCLLFGALLSGWLYYRNRKNTEVPGRVLGVLFTLRFLSATLLALLLIQIFFRKLNNETENPLILLALDNSGSMVAGPDSGYVRNEFMAAVEKFRSELSGKYELRSFTFGSRVQPFTSASFDEKETDFDQLIAETENNYSNRNVGALVIMSDGIYNKGANPLYSVEKLGYPVYCVALGDTSQIQDVGIQKVNYNEVVYAGNNFPAEVVVSARRSAGKVCRVNLLENNVIKASQQLTITSGNFIGSCTFTLSAERPGIQRYSVNLSYAEREKNEQNNSQSFLVEVIESKVKILLLASAPHPDISAIRTALLSSGNYQLDCILQGEPVPALQAYNLVIIHGLTAAQHGLLGQCRQQKMPYWIVRPYATDLIPSLKIQTQLSKTDDAEPLLNATFGLFSLSPEWTAFSRDLPAVKTPFGRYQLSNGSQVLLKQKIGSLETDNPLLYFSEDEGNKTAVFLGEGLWRWRLRDYSEHKDHKLFYELLGKTVQYLVVKEDKSFFRLKAPRVIRENEPLEIGAEVYNRSYEPVTDPEVALELFNSDDNKFNYSFSVAGKGYHLNAGLLEPGDYRFVARARVNNELLVKEGFLTVKEVVTEKINTVADHAMLRQLAEKTGGLTVAPQKLLDLLHVLSRNEEIRPVTYSQVSTTSLVDLKWIFVLLTLLLAAEWYIRKRYLVI